MGRACRMSLATLSFLTVALHCATLDQSANAVDPQREEQRQPVSATTLDVKEPISDGVVKVTLINRTSIALEAWCITLEFETATEKDARIEVVTDAYASLAFPTTTASTGPISGGETRDITIPAVGITKTTGVRLTMALYSDLTFEGEVTQRDAVLQRRDKDAEELAEWIAILTAVQQSRSPDGGGALLRDHLEKDMRIHNTPSALKKALRDTIRQLDRISRRQPDKFGEATTQVKAMLMKRRSLALRHRSNQ